jgi:hypothetical protein
VTRYSPSAGNVYSNEAAERRDNCRWAPSWQALICLPAVFYEEKACGFVHNAGALPTSSTGPTTTKDSG